MPKKRQKISQKQRLKKSLIKTEVEHSISDYTSKLGISRQQALKRIIVVYKTAIEEYKGNDKDYIPDYKMAIVVARSLAKNKQ